MAHVFKVFPANAVSPCVRAHGTGAVFSTVFPDGGERGLQLIHRGDGGTVYIPLTDEYRIGKVFSVRIDPFDAGEWFYRYRSGRQWFLDPRALGVCKTLIREEGTEKEVFVCSCDPLRPKELFDGAPEPQLPPADWNRQLVYGLHVKGFTALMEDIPAGVASDLNKDRSLRGTFAGLQSQIPRLLELGVTAVELMPVYTPLPDRKRTGKFRTMKEALSAWPVSPQGDPLRDMKERPNYWGFGRGMYFALRKDYGRQEEFARMVRAFHSAGIRVILELYFEKGTQVPEQIAVVRFYVLRFGIDGFRLMGHVPSPAAVAFEPSLSDTAFVFDSFPFGGSDGFAESDGSESGAWDVLEAGTPSFANILTCGGDFQPLLRRFVKSDDYVMRDFLKLFLSVPRGHGEIRHVTGFDGFTLADLVSYSERHNEANGECGLDGRTDDYSWNCGAEGETLDQSILSLRRKQIRNFLTLLFLSQGTPRLWQGDECLHTQGGNNNPYCQDNEISWVDWTPSPEKKALTAFTARLAAFRRNHPVFRSVLPFQYIDYLGIGHPDVSLHGAEAWKPDLGSFSHSIGICFCENYAGDSAGKLSAAASDVPVFRSRGRSMLPAFTYLAVNMYWKKLSLALPKLPPHYIWKVFLDTSAEEGFLEKPFTPPDSHRVETAPRSICLLRAVPDAEDIRRSRLRDRLETLPPLGAVRRALRTGRGSASVVHYCKTGAARVLRAAGTAL